MLTASDKPTERTPLAPSPSISGSEQKNASPKAGASTREPQLGECLIWNPIAITLWGIIFGFVFSSILVALNWHFLKRRTFAILACLAGILYFFFIQDALLEIASSPLRLDLLSIVTFLIVWFPVLGLTQINYVRKNLPPKYPRRSWLLPIPLGIALLFAITIMDRRDRETGALPDPSQTAARPQDQSDRIVYTPEEVARLVRPCVVEIHAGWQESLLYFFHTPGGASGSAVIFRTEPGKAYLVTNRHVVEPPAEAQNFECLFRDGEATGRVELLAYAKHNLDLALLRVRQSDITGSWQIPTQSLRDAAIGQPCLAIGNALGEGISTTAGIVSRLDSDGVSTLIRISAPISPGNSGGGLFSLKGGGSLMGITTSSLEVQHAQNINFAIPADYFTSNDAWEYLPGMTP